MGWGRVQGCVSGGVGWGPGLCVGGGGVGRGVGWGRVQGCGARFSGVGWGLVAGMWGGLGPEVWDGVGSAGAGWGGVYSFGEGCVNGVSEVGPVPWVCTGGVCVFVTWVCSQRVV